jgi:2-isopropylmalate synthase
MTKKKIEIYDTTLRDGSQGEGISFSVQDKLLILKKLDEMGFDYVEGGWPGANPKDSEFFDEAKKVKLKHAKLAAFGSTRRAHTKASEDANLKGLVAAETPVVTIFGKSWDLHVTEVFKIELEENLRMIEDSVKFLKSKGKKVVYDAEHFFDGYEHNAKYAMKAIETAYEAGASVIVLCDTNGGTMPSRVTEVVKEVKAKLKAPLGIHTHNDGAMGAANAVAAVEAGAVHVQGTVNGIGERCGNCDLIPVVANLQLKYGYDCLPKEKLKELTELSRFVNEVCNVVPSKSQPYVGQSAFAHKGGVHIDAVKKNPITYEHIDPSLVGNHRRHLVSEVGGRTNILLKAEELGIDLKKDSPETRKILEAVQKMENEGYQFESAEASYELLVRRIMGKGKPFFKVVDASVSNEKVGEEKIDVKAKVRLSVDDKEVEKTCKGDGPVDALGTAFTQALAEFYPQVREVRLEDYKVRIVDSKSGTAAKVRVIIEFHDKNHIWSTIGVSTNIVEASWKAIVDAYVYKLLKDLRK